MLDGAYRMQNGVAEFHSVRIPTTEQLAHPDHPMHQKALTRHGALIEEEEGMTYLADIELDVALAPLQSVVCTYRIALGSRPGQKVLTLRTVRLHKTHFRSLLSMLCQRLRLQPVCQGALCHEPTKPNWNICAATCPDPRLPMNVWHATRIDK